MNINRDTGRAKNFSSSKIYLLMTNSKAGGIGATGLTYIEEKRLENKLGRELQKETNARPASWGTFLQDRVTDVLLDNGCKRTKDIRRAHPEIEFWTGAEDYLRPAEEIAGEIKCFELKKFCKAYDAAQMGFEFLKEECPEIAWQLVSHAILLGWKKAELTLYVPYKEELSAIREEADQSDTPYEFQWIKYAKDEELPYLIKGLHYPNLTSFRFDISDSDKKALTSRVETAIKLLQP